MELSVFLKVDAAEGVNGLEALFLLSKGSEPGIAIGVGIVERDIEGCRSVAFEVTRGYMEGGWGGDRTKK